MYPTSIFWKISLTKFIELFLLLRQEFKNLNIPVIETSSHENINVDTAFFAIAQLIDKTRGRSRITSYMESAHMRRELLDMTTENYVRLLRANVQVFFFIKSQILPNKKSDLLATQSSSPKCVFLKDSGLDRIRIHTPGGTSINLNIILINMCLKNLVSKQIDWIKQLLETIVFRNTLMRLY